MADPKLDELYRRVVGSGDVDPMAHMREIMAAGVVKVAAGGGGGGGPEHAPHPGDPAAIMNAALLAAPLNLVPGPDQIYSQAQTDIGYRFGDNVMISQPSGMRMPGLGQTQHGPAGQQLSPASGSLEDSIERMLPIGGYGPAIPTDSSIETGVLGIDVNDTYFTGAPDLGIFGEIEGKKKEFPCWWYVGNLVHVLRYGRSSLSMIERFLLLGVLRECPEDLCKALNPPGRGTKTNYRLRLLILMKACLLSIRKVSMRKSGLTFVLGFRESVGAAKYDLMIAYDEICKWASTMLKQIDLDATAIDGAFTEKERTRIAIGVNNLKMVLGCPNGKDEVDEDDLDEAMELLDTLAKKLDDKIGQELSRR